MTVENTLVLNAAPAVTITPENTALDITYAPKPGDVTPAAEIDALIAEATAKAENSPALANGSNAWRLQAVAQCVADILIGKYAAQSIHGRIFSGNELNEPEGLKLSRADEVMALAWDRLNGLAERFGRYETGEALVSDAAWNTIKDCVSAIDARPAHLPTLIEAEWADFLANCADRPVTFAGLNGTSRVYLVDVRALANAAVKAAGLSDDTFYASAMEALIETVESDNPVHNNGKYLMDKASYDALPVVMFRLFDENVNDDNWNAYKKNKVSFKNAVKRVFENAVKDR